MSKFLFAKALGTIVASAFVLTPIATLAASAPIFGILNTSTTKPSGPPIQIETCGKATNAFGQFAMDFGAIYANPSNAYYSVVFTNESGKTADVIRFQVEEGHKRFFIRDQGQFVSGITITHAYAVRSKNMTTIPGDEPHSACTVDAIHFTDGSDWTPPVAPPAVIVVNPSVPQDTFGGKYVGASFKQTPGAVEITSVLPDSPADSAGLIEGDVIGTIDGNRVFVLSEVLDYIAKAQGHDPLDVVIVRYGVHHSVILKIAKD